MLIFLITENKLPLHVVSTCDNKNMGKKSKTQVVFLGDFIKPTAAYKENQQSGNMLGEGNSNARQACVFT